MLTSLSITSYALCIKMIEMATLKKCYVLILTMQTCYIYNGTDSIWLIRSTIFARLSRMDFIYTIINFVIIVVLLHVVIFLSLMLKLYAGKDIRILKTLMFLSMLGQLEETKKFGRMLCLLSPKDSWSPVLGTRVRIMSLYHLVPVEGFAQVFH